MLTSTGARLGALKAEAHSLKSEVSVLGVSGVLGLPLHLQILADQLTLFQPGGTDYAHLITTGTPGFSDLPTALVSKQK